MLPLNLAVNVVLGLVVLFAARQPRPLALAPAILLLAPVVALPFGLGGPAIFPAASGLAWAIFGWGPVLLLVDARGRPSRARSLGQAVLALLLIGVGVWSFVVEPRWLDVHVEPLPGPKLRVALVADIQADEVDAHTAAAFAAVRDAQPDLVLYAGDYLQLPAGPAFDAEAEALRALVATLSPRLGSVAVRGDVDPDTWAASFAGTGVRIIEHSTTLPLDGLTVTALDTDDSRSGRPPVPRVEGFHIVFGHAPDFVLAEPEGDLFLAGHTHGGQVRLPWFGPLLTFSNVPRAMAAGLSHLPRGGSLYVSRGIGMERRDAPRLRFNCRPEVVIFDLGGQQVR